ncbi:non-ribosomal peptide synthetase, partial [Bacillus wiedmannii]|uniref:non-ribosomal peptide synthetase n=1 Tax=Bacillus wiedmannii TaxID=1890302 RepID=UPI000BFAF1A9
WEYCTDLFKEKTIARMNEQFVQLLKNALKDPQKKLCEIELLTDTEKEKVIYEFNRTHIEYQNDKTIIERFEEQVEKTPDKIAVEYEGESLTYRQLNAKANTIGKNLRDKGVHTESIVGIVTKRSLEMIVGIYGVLKAGGAYLPIDSEYPVERINFMLNDSKAKVLLVGEGNQSIVDHIDASTILVNLTNCEEDQINPVHISQPDSLAYVIYTSGTTGTPKGVMVENRNVMNLSNWQIDEGKYGEDTVVLQNLNYIFDGSVWEIFPVTLSGGKLLIISEIQNKEPRELLTLLEKKQALLVPSMFRMLLEHAEKNGKADELKQFERLYLGAEPLTSDLIAKYEEITGASIDNINNLYGPTEATVVATSYRFNGKDNREIIPIGKPIANTQIYILNNKSICGIGMPGELCIGGSGVSRGYLNRAELTAEKFVVNPYRPNERIYRTGDLARWNEDGNIEYLGRIDEQVKIRGFRIELGEIEERIRDVEGISDAVV